MKRINIFKAIEDERAYQDKIWGKDFDQLNTINDWVAFIIQYAGRAVASENVNKPGAQREALVKVAALCVAALEQPAFAPRHYEVRED